MATLHSKIEEYVGREVDFVSEVQVFDDAYGNLTIGKWGIEDPAEPTMEQLDALDTAAAERDAAKDLAMLRLQRDQKLAETDWWASSDLTMTAEQASYRQALRDITNNATSLDDVTWPTKP